MSYVPALVMIGIWIVTQIASVWLAGEAAAGGGGVAYWAHVGGFVTGIVLAFLFRNRESSATSPIYSR